MSTIAKLRSKFEPAASPSQSSRPPDGEQKPTQESRASCTEFYFHSSYYRDFFLLRTTITINGRPAVIKVVNGDPVLRVSRGVSVKLSVILQQAVSPVLTKHGVYQVENFYYEQVPLFSMKFRSMSSLKQFLSDKEAVQKELSSAVTNVGELKIKSAKNQYPPKQLQVAVGTEVYLFSPIAQHSPQIEKVNSANHSFMFEQWKRSKLFDFTGDMYTMKPPGMTAGAGVQDSLQCHTTTVTATGLPKSFQDSPQSATSQTFVNVTVNAKNEPVGNQGAKLADLQRELKSVVEWFGLGVQLEIPTDDLKTIRKDYHYQTADCRQAMLVRWGELDKPTWSKLVTALINIDRKALANKLAKKYGMPGVSGAINNFKDNIESQCSTEGNIIGLEDEVEIATRSCDALSKALEIDIESIPELQIKISYLSKEVSHLKQKLINKEEENKMLDEMNESLKDEWRDAFTRTRRELIKEIKVLKLELTKKEDELSQAKKKLSIKEIELNEKIKELNEKSAHVIQLQRQLQEMREKFNTEREEMDQKLMESKAHAHSHEKDLKSQRNFALKKVTEMSEKIENHTAELSLKEKQIRELSEKIAEQEREMAKLREKLNSRTSDRDKHISKDDEQTQQRLSSLV